MTACPVVQMLPVADQSASAFARELRASGTRDALYADWTASTAAESAARIGGGHEAARGPNRTKLSLHIQCQIAT